MSLKEVIEKRTKELEEKLKIKDFKAASTYYTENCVLMPSTGETFVGRNEIIKFCEVAYAQGNPEVLSKVLEIIGDENHFVISRGSYTVCNEGAELCRGTFVHIWKKVNDQFEMQQDIWNEAKRQ